MKCREFTHGAEQAAVPLHQRHSVRREHPVDRWLLGTSTRRWQKEREEEEEEHVYEPDALTYQGLSFN